MVLTPNDLFSWNNKYSKYMFTHYALYIEQIHFVSQLCTLLTLCMLVILSRDGVVFFVLSCLSISLGFTSYLLLCPKLTDAPCPGSGPPPRLLSQDGVFIHRVRTHSPSRVHHTPLVRIRWIHLRRFSRPPPFLWHRPYVRHLCFLPRHPNSNGAHLSIGLLF
jgi:hypothetical protein